MTQEEMKVLQGMFEALRKHTAQMMEEVTQASEKRMSQEREATKRELKETINGLDMKLENHFQKIHNLLQEDYGRIEGNAAKGAEVAKSYEEVKGTQADHTRAIRQHNERLTVLEEKAH